MSTAAGSRRWLWGLIAVLAAWGIYLAIGATGIFTDVGLFDARRSVIVLICSASFLGFWVAILLRRPVASAALPRSPFNRSSLVSLLAIGSAFACWAAAWMAWGSGNPANLTFVLGWISVGLFAVAAILALIGLSDPQHERGKLWGLLTLALLLAAGVGLILQVRHYTSSQGRTVPSVRRSPTPQDGVVWQPPFADEQRYDG